MWSRAASSWRRQSHFTECSTSPVKHSEWTRTGTGASPATSPRTIATWVTAGSWGSAKATQVKVPWRVGRGVVASRSGMRDMTA